jgi:hypothetical protein
VGARLHRRHLHHAPVNSGAIPMPRKRSLAAGRLGRAQRRRPMVGPLGGRVGADEPTSPKRRSLCATRASTTTSLGRQLRPIFSSDHCVTDRSPHHRHPLCSESLRLPGVSPIARWAARKSTPGSAAELTHGSWRACCIRLRPERHRGGDHCRCCEYLLSAPS